MKIKLIEPTRYLEDGRLLKRKKLFVPSLTLPYLAALTPPAGEVTIVNELIQDIDFSEPVDLVGITAYTNNVLRAYEIADEYRKRKVPVVMGGIHVSAVPLEAKEHADTIIIGEAEKTWPRFIADFINGQPRTLYETKAPPSLNKLPLPRFSLLSKHHYFGYERRGLSRYLIRPIIPVQTARGCPFSCDFCSVTRFFGGDYRMRPIPEVIAEIKKLAAKNCFFVDDNIFAVPQRARKLFTALTPLKIKWVGQATIAAAADPGLLQLARRSGCVELSIGLESLSGDCLQSVGKTINRSERYESQLRVYRESGIIPTVSMMFGFDADGPEVFQETATFLIRNRVAYIYWWPLTPLPGTPFYQKLLQQGRLRDPSWWLNRDMLQFSLKFSPAKMDDRQFAENFQCQLHRFFSLPNTVKRLFFPPQKKCLQAFFLNLAYGWRRSKSRKVIQSY